MRNNYKLLPYILNEQNKYITKQFIQGMLGRYGIKYKVQNIGLYRSAMVHVSYLIRDEKFYSNNKTKPYRKQTTEIEPLDPHLMDKVIPLQSVSLERTEFLGDGAFHFVLAEYIFHRYPDEEEGFMTKLRTKIENGDSMAILSRKLGLDEYAIISRHMELNGSRANNNSLLEDIFESFICVLYLDAGFDILRKFLFTLFEREINFSKLLYTETNFKEKIVRYFHMKGWEDPIFGQLDVSGPDKNKKYTMYVKCKKTPQDEGSIVGIGVSTSKKGGEQAASENALAKFGVGNDCDSDIEEYEILSDSE